MRNPVRSEADAFHIVSGSALVIGAAVILGALTTPVAGVALLLGAVVGACIWEFGTNDPDRLRPIREAAEQGRVARPRTRRRVLVVANRTLPDAGLRAELLRRGEAGAELRFIVPILTSRVHYIASDVDSELREAHRRLAEALAWASAAGLEVTGKVGDPMVAFAAIEDDLRLSGADEVIVSTHPPGQSNWLETGIVARLRDELDIPVTHVVGEVAREQAAA